MQGVTSRSEAIRYEIRDARCECLRLRRVAGESVCDGLWVVIRLSIRYEIRDARCECLRLRRVAGESVCDGLWVVIRLSNLVSRIFIYPTRTAPPLTLKISPEMKPAQGEQRNTIGPAISSGSAARPSGIRSSAFLDAIGSLRVPADISVRTHPGATQLHRIPWGASSEERLLVRESRA